MRFLKLCLYTKLTKIKNTALKISDMKIWIISNQIEKTVDVAIRTNGAEEKKEWQIQ